MKIRWGTAVFLCLSSLLCILSSPSAFADDVYFTELEFTGPCTNYNINGACTGPLSATVGLPFKASLTADCGTADVDKQPWSAGTSIATGRLPPGLKLDNAGNITGVPELAGDWNFSVAVTDIQCEDGTFADRTVTVRIVITGS